MRTFSPEIRKFISQVEWVFAKTYAQTWPHHYIVKERVDESLFIKLVAHIRENGYQSLFYRTPITYFDEDGMVYWTMVPPVDDPNWYPIEDETIINRCAKENTYDARFANGTLPP
jgi:hypothetical protein